jgi:hypothetical protein
LEHLIPNDGRPWPTAAKAYSICASFPEGEKVVKLHLERDRDRDVPEGVSICHCWLRADIRMMMKRDNREVYAASSRKGCCPPINLKCDP